VDEGGGGFDTANTEILGNLISGNDSGGVDVEGPGGFVIQGNLIGLNSLGTGPLPNSQEGILIGNTSGTTVGGTQSGAANKIAFNGKSGIRFMGGNGNAVRGNSMFSNGGLGIDVDPNGVTGQNNQGEGGGPDHERDRIGVGRAGNRIEKATRRSALQPPELIDVLPEILAGHDRATLASSSPMRLTCSAGGLAPEPTCRNHP